MILLSRLLERAKEAGLVIGVQGSFDKLEIDHLAIDSRKVGPGGLFVAIRGEEADGHLFIDKAVQNGAIAIACETVPGSLYDRLPGIVFVRVTDSRATIAELSGEFYGDPSHDLLMAGVTGTNGKTTVANLLHHLFAGLGRRSGLIGTIEIRIGDDVEATGLTTPDALDIHRILRKMVDEGCTACAMETSSHALHQERVRSVAFDAGIFTNLSRDHLDYHKTLDDYRAAKKKLFDGLPSGSLAIYNADDASGPLVVTETAADKISYGMSDDVDVQVSILEDKIEGLRLVIDGRRGSFRLVGQFNAYNLAAAYAAGKGLGFSSSEVFNILEAAPPVPGRFEQIRFDDGTTVIVDYAHTPDALENVLTTALKTKPEGAPLWCVFGCGGDRDREKRPQMGAIAERYAHHTIVTSDNPRHEDPRAIMSDIREGFDRPESAQWIDDREAAIYEAAQQAAAGDVIVIAGKGHETYQIIGDEKRPFDDRRIVRRAFSARGTGDRHLD